MKKETIFALFGIFIIGFLYSCNKKDTENSYYYVAFNCQDRGNPIDTIFNVAIGSTIEEPTAPNDEFYIFEGWFKDASTTIPWDFETETITCNTTLYAKWVSIGTKTVNFYTGGLASVPKITVESGMTITTPEDPINEDNYFKGWYKEKSCINAWNFENDIVTQNTILYAKWTPKYKYYGAELYSKETFTYGRFEARMKMAYAPGCISSMFLYYNQSDVAGSSLWNEIDIEVIGKDSLKFQSNIITGNRENKKTSEKHHQPGTALNTDYHTFVIEWTPEHVIWQVDGVELRRTEATESGTDQVTALIKDQSLRFNVWASSSTSWVGKMTHLHIPIAQYIDYITVYDYNTETKEFTERWKDDFESFNSDRWSKGNWQMDLVTERTTNVIIENGNLVLKLTKEKIPN